jgi:type IV pilus assembly protein PilE
MKAQMGMTLIELLIVMAIVGVLAALAYPSYGSYVRKARRAEGQTALLETMQHQERYYTENNRYLPFSADTDTPGAVRFRWWSGQSARESAYEISAQACPGHGLERCIELRAVPGTVHVDGRFRDAECETLILDSVGRRRATGSGQRCWP